MFDISFDFRMDSNGKDPDSNSLMLKKYHQMLWSKKLPIGEELLLSEDLTCVAGGRIWEFASDSIVHTYFRWKKYREIIDGIDSNEMDEFLRLSYSIGGFIVFPRNKIDGKMTINGARGLNRKINDRIDLTLECIKRYYIGQNSPLADCLDRYSAFFDLFVDFKGYVDYFYL
jgi:hypothetical protein